VPFLVWTRRICSPYAQDYDTLRWMEKNLDQSVTSPDASNCLAFWQAAGPEKWFAKDDTFDAAFRDCFYDLHFAAARRECEHWLETPDGALALMILLDQFPRNAFRNTGHMYATDPLARFYARTAIARGHDFQVDPMLRGFFYLPFGHSEDLSDQDFAVEHCRDVSERWDENAKGHRDIVRRFGRFPHRNLILGRVSTEEEMKFLAGGGFAG
jgi:uncharacterized protein (DUF924 family)